MTRHVAMRQKAPLIGLVCLALLTACNRRPGAASSTAAAPPPVAQSSSATPAAGSNERLRAAAEPFEALTEQAFTAPLPDLGKLVQDAHAKAQAVRPALNAQAAQGVQQLSAELDRAYGAQDRTAIAIAAVETYRALVSAQDALIATPPVEVSLLDYAGFKYDALLNAQPVNWAELAKVIAYARENWVKLSPRVTSPGLKASFDEALRGMEAGVTEKNAGLARHSATTELALVDLLEEHFTTSPPPR